MTIPREEMNALICTRGWLYEQLTRRGRVRITELRKDVLRLLRHYPTDYRIEQVYKDEVGEYEAEVANTAPHGRDERSVP